MGRLFAGGGLRGRVGQQIEHTSRFRPRKAAAFIPGQAEQVEQHLAVQTAVDFLQVQLFGAGLVVHHPHPAGAVLLHPLDVYKRQVHDLPALEGLLGRKLRISPSQLEKYYTCRYGYFLQYVLGLRPVSYTHLDVYKRQG